MLKYCGTVAHCEAEGDFDAGECIELLHHYELLCEADKPPVGRSACCVSKTVSYYSVTAMTSRTGQGEGNKYANHVMLWMQFDPTAFE